MGKLDMQYTKKVADLNGDVAVVEGGERYIWLTVEDEIDTVLLQLSPRQARKIGKALRKAAKAVEGRG